MISHKFLLIFNEIIFLSPSGFGNTLEQSEDHLGRGFSKEELRRCYVVLSLLGWVLFIDRINY